MSDYLETLRVAFQVHHAQLVQTRQKIHATSATAVGVFLLAIGWAFSVPGRFAFAQQCLSTACVSIVMLIAQLTLWSNSQSYVEVARVIHKINLALGLHKPHELTGKAPLYPSSWQHFERLSTFKTVWSHLVIVFTVWLMALCVLWYIPAETKKVNSVQQPTMRPSGNRGAPIDSAIKH